MTILNNLPSIFVPLVGLVFPAIAMASLFLYVQKTRFFRSDGGKFHLFFFSRLRLGS